MNPRHLAALVRRDRKSNAISLARHLELKRGGAPAEGEGEKVVPQLDVPGADDVLASPPAPGTEAPKQEPEPDDVDVDTDEDLDEEEAAPAAAPATATRGLEAVVLKEADVLEMIAKEYDLPDPSLVDALEADTRDALLNELKLMPKPLRRVLRRAGRKSFSYSDALALTKQLVDGERIVDAERFAPLLYWLAHAYNS